MRLPSLLPAAVLLTFALTAPAFAQEAGVDGPVATADPAAHPPSGGVIAPEAEPMRAPGVDTPLEQPEVKPCHGVVSGSVGTGGYRRGAAAVQCADAKGNVIGIAVDAGRGPDYRRFDDRGQRRRR